MYVQGVNTSRVYGSYKLLKWPFVALYRRFECEICKIFIYEFKCHVLYFFLSHVSLVLQKGQMREQNLK